MLNLDPGKLLIIGVVAVLLLGPDRLPHVARQVGATWRAFSDFRHRMEAEVRSNMPDLPPTSDLAHLARSPSALLNHLSTMASDEETVEEPPVEGGMTWVTADYSTTAGSTQPLASAVTGDANLN